MKYQLTRTCKDCKNIDLTEITKIEAAFELYDTKPIWKTPCSKCGVNNCSSIGHHKPIIDKELLDIWGNDLKLFFMPQDQELILAEYDYFPMLLTAIDEAKYLKPKINVLIEAICVLLYDNTVSPEEYSEKENQERESLAEKIRPELERRKDRIIEAGENVWEYIRIIVYPQIGIEIK